MKKLMIAVAVVCAVAVTQAASINWGTGNQVKAAKSATDGTFGGSNCGDGTLQIIAYVYASETARDAALAANGGDVWATYSSGALDAGGTYAADWSKASTVGKGLTGVTASVDVGSSWSSEKDTSYYGLVITTYDGDSTKAGPEWYISNAATGLINTSGTTVTNPTSLAKKIGGTGDAITGWTATAVPEPTSGLLLLLGVAGLALRRRRA